MKNESIYINTFNMLNSHSLPEKLSFDIFSQQSDRDKSIFKRSLNDGYIFKGLVGHGVQSWCWRIIWETSQCGVALDIPIRGIYSDIDTTDNMPAQDIGELFVNSCSSAMESEFYFQNQKANIYIIMDADEFKFKIVNTRDNKTIYEGSVLAELLDILESSNKKQIHGKNI
ncbi:hypothetical protein MTY45_000507 [Salmonella enterica]|nr:hypothetical protein [Salmonella enterica]